MALMNPVRASMFYVYVLRSNKSGRLYTGYTSDLRKRLTEHLQKQSIYTAKRGPYELIYYEACIDHNDAAAREKYLKSGPGKRYLKNRVKRFLAQTG
jgi:putative endonuclease